MLFDDNRFCFKLKAQNRIDDLVLSGIKSSILWSYNGSLLADKYAEFLSGIHGLFVQQ